MFRRASHVMMLGLGLYGGDIASAGAQQKSGRDVVYEAARNRIGLLRHCRDTGLLDKPIADVAIQVTEGELASFPAADTPLGRRYGDAAEKDGEAGVLGPDSKRDMAAFAALFKTTPANLCREWAVESLRGVKGRSIQQAEPREPARPAPPPVSTATVTAAPRGRIVPPPNPAGWAPAAVRIEAVTEAAAVGPAAAASSPVPAKPRLSAPAETPFDPFGQHCAPPMN
jgi:hypothetical protein